MTTAPVKPSTLCPVCAKPVVVVARPDQRARHLAFHGPRIGILCPGSGTPATDRKTK